MRQKIILLLLFIPIYLLTASDFQQNSRIAKEINHRHFRINENNFRDNKPEITFEITPQQIINSLYDYMQGGYNIPPLILQPANSEPYSYPADGIYLAFMFQQNASSLRRIYYSYIHSDGTIQTPTSVSSNSVREGFAGIALDPVTANPFVAWHSIVEPDQSYDNSFSFDMYNVIGGPGLWTQAQICVDNPEIGLEIAGISGNEYVWPELRVGPS
ncbi:MAG: hypothetical protein JW996_01115, partial [Candidatus Cloacimonetes bacterium]|nr:hypothetical protein [Candidatus Cloacimonadota bacterium]